MTFDCRIVLYFEIHALLTMIILCKGLFGYFLEAFLNLLFELFHTYQGIVRIQ